MEIYDLRTEYCADPFCIEKERPRFSWKCAGAGEVQKTYRVLAATSCELLQEGEADLWDSGIVSSGRTIGIRYAGVTLLPQTIVYWKVIVNGKESEVAHFEMAPALEDWTGCWIGMPFNFSGSTLLFRGRFTVDGGKKVVRARAYVAGLGFFRCFLNGKVLDDEVLNPPISVYEKTIYYKSYPLHLVEGTNILGVEIGYGWYGSRILNALIFVHYEDGTFDKFVTSQSEDWLVSGSAIVSNSIYEGEVYDARRRDPLFLLPEHSLEGEIGFCIPVRVIAPHGRLVPARIPGMRVVETLPSVSIQAAEKGKFIVDFGKNIQGWCRIRVRGERGASVTILYAERLQENGEINRINLRGAANRDVYILSGEGEEEYAPSFTYHGFQYAQVCIEGSAELVWIEAEHICSAIEKAGSFLCSDNTLNRLHAIAVTTESNNLNGVYTDCPQRDERFGWLNDITSRIYQSVCNFDNSLYLSNFIDMITDSQREDGAIPDTVPFFCGGCPADPVSAYILLGLLCWKLYGDREVLEKNYDGFSRWFGYLDRRAVGGVLSDGVYGDWVPAAPYTIGGGESPFSKYITPAFISAAYFGWYASMMAEIADTLDKIDDANMYRKKHAEIFEAFLNRYYDEKTGLFGSGGQSECAVVITAFPEFSGNRELAAHAERDILARGLHTTCGNQGYRHLFYRLAEYGYSDTLVELLKNPEYPGWGYMLSKGATSVWERWEDTMLNKMHSFNHPMLASYDGFFYNYLAGIRVHECEDAFGSIVIAPELPRSLQWVKASLKTVRGEIVSDWKRLEKAVHLHIETPANTVLTVRVPGLLRSINGQPAIGEGARLGNGVFDIIFVEETKEERDSRWRKCGRMSGS